MTDDLYIEIETDIPIPINSRKGSHYKYPFGNMEVGDSFFYPSVEYQRLYSASSYYGKRNCKKFKVRREFKGKIFGCRVWRIL